MPLCNHPAKLIDSIGRCTVCHSINNAARGHRKPQTKREARIAEVSDTAYPGKSIDGSIKDPADFARWLGKLVDDPVRLAALESDSRRPAGVSKARFGIAIRSANRTPMLNADPADTRNALEGRTRAFKSGVMKGKIFKKITVKPDSSKTGKSGWQERLWYVYEMKYARGLVIVTDEGDESKVFKTWAEMHSAIIQAGWRLVK